MILLRKYIGRLHLTMGVFQVCGTLLQIREVRAKSCYTRTSELVGQSRVVNGEYRKYDGLDPPVKPWDDGKWSVGG